jgi:hypothetical protein
VNQEATRTDPHRALSCSGLCGFAPTAG